MAVVSVAVFFIEDLLKFVLRRSADFQRALVQYLSRRKGFSVVRKIGSHMTWLHAQRLHILSIEGLGDNVLHCDRNNALESYCQCFKKPVEDVKESLQLESDVEELKKELCDLQSKVTRLLLIQESKALDDNYSEKENMLQTMTPESVVSSSTSFMPPPPPPPLPPPMPPTPYVHKTVVVKAKQNTTNKTIIKSPICNIMEELSKRPPKLRHVELTPGGRPLRQVTSCTGQDPSDILIAVLKKRFEAIHSPQREHCLISPNGSPGSPMVFG
ncbi:mitochondrial fission regulator 1-like [Homalodisca vitripennis]|uniref:mitochondrial fission regulator 1-like n=1 Tax=Homalodisca vitripennis TaxID=197043 RepID=UPI001EE9D08F|nr:mitochondrial fission regulator 1-like [Homalodisca vitripennis]